MKAFIQFRQFQFHGLLPASSMVVAKRRKQYAVEILRFLGAVEATPSGKQFWVNDTRLKRELNLFDLESQKWVKQSYRELLKKAPEWLTDPMIWKIKWAQAVRNGHVNEQRT